MPLPAPLLLGGAALLLFFLSSSDDKKKTPGGGSLPGGGTPGGNGGNGGGKSPVPPVPEDVPPGGVEDWPYAACLDDAMPPAQKALVNQLLESSTDPAALDAAAKLAADTGYPLAAACLKAAADLHRGGGGSPGSDTPVPPVLGPMPFTVRYGDAPYALALYYTGQGSRYPELASQNSNLGPLVQRPLNDGSGKTYQAYKNWQPGLKIQLPLSWDPWTRPLPKPGGQSPSTTLPVPGVGA